MTQHRDHTRDKALAEPGASASPDRSRLSATALSAGAGGNLLEWYDFGIYGLLAPVIASDFFPADDRIASLIGAYGLFAAGFAMRPIGGLVLGHLGDRLGRRFVLVYSIVLMGCATAAIAFLPRYETIGVGAPLLLLLLRLVQGFSVGGEFTSSASYLVETAPQHRRGFAGTLPISVRPRACCWRPRSLRRPSLCRALSNSMVGPGACPSCWADSSARAPISCAGACATAAISLTLRNRTRFRR
jgi:hypothetical protein